MRTEARQPYLFQLPCGRCPVRDCLDRGDIDRACDPLDLQAPDHAALSHHSQNLPILLDQLADFGLPEHLPQAYAGPLPPYLPQMEPHTALLDSVPDAVALVLGDFVSPKGRSYRAGINRARLLRARGASVVVLVGTSFDPQLEAVWKEPFAFIDALNQAEVDIVLGPAFSIYVDRPTLERNANRSRSLDLYRLLTEAGVHVIPAVGFVDAVDAARVGDWVTGYGLRSIFIDLQSAGHRKNWDHAREALRVLIARAHSLERVVINGVAHPDRVPELARLTKPLELVLTNGYALQLAGARRDYSVEGGRFVMRRSEAPPAHLFANWASFYSGAATRRIERYIPLSLQPSLL